MTRWISLFALVAVAGGCGLSEDKFQDEYVTTACEKQVECAAEGIEIDQAACEAFLKAFVEAASAAEGCEYDKKQAKECLNEIEDATCDAEADAEPATSACDSVYTGTCDATTEE